MTRQWRRAVVMTLLVFRVPRTGTCPQPGKNLPPNWKDMREEKQFLYALFVAIDASFRLKRKDILSEEKDPGLGNGWAFYCKVLAYMQHVKRNWNQKQIRLIDCVRSHCVAHDAVDKPDRKARGTVSSGIGAVDCARHNMKRPLAVGHLQWGERVAGPDLLQFFVSYDIACQWRLHIWEHMIKYQDKTLTLDRWGNSSPSSFPNSTSPPTLRPATSNIHSISPPTSARQTEKCQSADTCYGVGHGIAWVLDKVFVPLSGWEFSVTHPDRSRSSSGNHPGLRILNILRLMCPTFRQKYIHYALIVLLGLPEYCRGVRSNSASSGGTRGPMGGRVEDCEMGPGFRWDTLDDQFNDWNHKKIIALGYTMHRKMEKAVPGMGAMRMTLVDMIMLLSLEVVKEWTEIAEKWEADARAPNPFKTIRKDQHVASMHAELAAEAEARELAGQEDADIVSAGLRRGSHGLAPNGWAASRDDGTHQQTTPQACRVDQCPAQVLPRAGEHQGTIKLWLPSDVARAPAADAAKVAVMDTTKKVVAGYRAACVALVVLGRRLNRREWEWTLQPLLEDDARGLPQSHFHDPEQKKKQKGRRRRKGCKVAPKLSWIWVNREESWEPSDDVAMNEVEVDLLEEEMRWIIEFLWWQLGWWKERLNIRRLSEADIQATLASEFLTEWKGLAQLIQDGRAREVAGVGEAEDANGADGAGGAEDGEGESEAGDSEEETLISKLL
ncbi:hypothetical protein B0H14DRAFT_2579203 [Mycena olivaceomarginata]|nr:hypothetical protein B0H14DRAFT_2579203 [Mycena olivaceomarginata]